MVFNRKTKTPKLTTEQATEFLIKRILEETGFDITSQLVPEYVVAYIKCDVAIRQALLDETIKNLKQRRPVDVPGQPDNVATIQVIE